MYSMYYKLHATYANEASQYCQLAKNQIDRALLTSLYIDFCPDICGAIAINGNYSNNYEKTCIISTLFPSISNCNYYGNKNRFLHELRRIGTRSLFSRMDETRYLRYNAFFKNWCRSNSVNFKYKYQTIATIILKNIVRYKTEIFCIYILERAM